MVPWGALKHYRDWYQVLIDPLGACNENSRAGPNLQLFIRACPETGANFRARPRNLTITRLPVPQVKNI